MKRVASIHRPGESHWVGDGFPVHTVLTYQELGAEVTPFLLLDHAGPAEFEASERERGVGWHPHRGFETVTIVYDGEVEHEDTAGNRGAIAPGDVQWMTAGSGLLHKELHGRDYARKGGRFEMLQLWVNLPAKSKMTPPRYQTLTRDRIPVVSLPANAGSVRVIAGELDQKRGPAQTFTPVHLFDVRLNAGGEARFDLRDGWSGALYVLKGTIVVNGEESARAGELVVLAREGGEIAISAETDATVFVMNGEPIDEPIAGYGPFVMNTREQILEAFADMRDGKLGRVPS
jgi:redox-sensitive bicupin YhaK (pirin superfamily)